MDSSANILTILNTKFTQSKHLPRKWVLQLCWLHKNWFHVAMQSSREGQYHLTEGFLHLPPAHLSLCDQTNPRSRSANTAQKVMQVSTDWTNSWLMQRKLLLTHFLVSFRMVFNH